MSGALFIFRIQHEYTQTQCEEGARYVIFPIRKHSFLLLEITLGYKPFLEE